MVTELARTATISETGLADLVVTGGAEFTSVTFVDDTVALSVDYDETTGVLEVTGNFGVAGVSVDELQAIIDAEAEFTAVGSPLS